MIEYRILDEFTKRPEIDLSLIFIEGNDNNNLLQLYNRLPIQVKNTIKFVPNLKFVLEFKTIVDDQMLNNLFYKHIEKLFKIIVHEKIKTLDTEILDLSIIENEHDKNVLQKYYREAIRRNFYNQLINEAFSINFITLHNVYLLKRYFDHENVLFDAFDKIYFENVWPIYVNELKKEEILKNNKKQNILKKTNLNVASQHASQYIHTLHTKEEIKVLPFSQLNDNDIDNLEKISIISDFDKIYHEIMSSIENNNLDLLIEPIYCTADTSIFISRKIDVLFHGGKLRRNDNRTDQNESMNEHEKIIMIDLINSINSEFIPKIFNDTRVIYPHGKKYLDQKVGSVMSSILVEGDVLLYNHIIDLYPPIQVNAFDDLSLFFNFLISGNDREEFRHIYIKIINFLKSKLLEKSDEHKDVFTVKWFESLIDNLQNYIGYLKTKQWYKNDGMQQFLDYIKGNNDLNSTPFLKEVFTYHNGWESSTWTDDYRYILLPNGDLNVHKIRQVCYEYFNVIQIGGIKYHNGNNDIDYKQKYLKYKRKYHLFKKY
jgi:hypothetical protein